MPESINVSCHCPICKKVISFDIKKDVVSNSSELPVQFLIEHCDQFLIAYVNQNYEVKGIHSISNILERNTNPIQKDGIQGIAITPEIIEKMALEEKLVLSSNSNYDSIMNQQLPDVLEKQVLLHIAKYDEISFAVLLKEISFLGKALNRKIDQDILQKIVDKYVEKGMINKQMVRFEKKQNNFNEIETNLRGDVV